MNVSSNALRAAAPPARSICTRPTSASTRTGAVQTMPYSWSKIRPGAPRARYFSVIGSDNPYGADGDADPQIKKKNPNQPANATAIGARSAATARRSHPVRTSATIATAAAIGAYFVLSHGSAPIAAPRHNHTPGDTASVRHAIATMTANAAGISGYTVNELKRKGAVSAAAAHANVAARTEPVISRAHCQSRAAASAAITTSIATTA